MNILAIDRIFFRFVGGVLSLAGAIGVRFFHKFGRSFVALGGYTLALFYGFTLSSVVPVF